ncbi:carboxypeptidase-like regulatory domain-containing protein, partial [bacterium]|nr:carboxypeptidase-like regulatory domain-containing protein [bacterium]
MEPSKRQIEQREKAIEKRLKMDNQMQGINDVDPIAVSNPHAAYYQPTDALFDHQFDFPCAVATGEAGIETDGDYIFSTEWNNAAGFFAYAMDGTYLGTFNVAGAGNVRDLAYDGSYFYGAAANTSLFEMDFDGATLSGTLISTIIAPVATRACAYDAEWDGFWGNNWSSDITLYDRTGGILYSFPCDVHSSYYGFARLDDAGSQWLYGFAQGGGVNQCDIVQIDPVTGIETGVNFDAIGYSPDGLGIAGGLAAFDTYAPGWWTLLGILQNQTIFGVEGGIAGPPPQLDLKLTGIPEPNTGYDLGVENIVIGVKNQGTITQSNFDVQYRVDGGAWVVETIPGPLTQNETITYTFTQTYDFSAFAVYYIEAGVILAGDEYPDNNSADKEIENWDPYAWCEYSITLWDDYGDGWNGGYVQIYGDGIEYINATLTGGSGPETFYFNVGDGAFLTSVFTPGGWEYECSYVVYNFYGEPIFEDGMGGVDPTGGDIGYAACEDPIIITWYPIFFTQNVIIDGTAQDFLSIGNIGTDVLVWNIDVIEPWLVVYPESGTIEPDGSQGVIIDFSAEGLNEGSYFADILITSNDPFTPEVIIPVEMIVHPIGQHFVFEGGNTSAPYWSLFLAEATINDINIVTGDEIGIFDGDLLVGVITLTQVCTPDNQFENALLAFSTLINGNSGYTPGNNVTLKCWDVSEQIEVSDFDIVFENPYGDAWIENTFPPGVDQYSIPHISFNWVPNGNIAGTVTNVSTSEPIECAEITIEGTSYFATSGIDGTDTISDIEPVTYNITASADGYYSVTKFDQIVISVQTTIVDFTLMGLQTYNLVTGYQFVSTRLIPENPDMLDVLENNLNDNLAFVRNTAGYTVRKIGPMWVNSIGDWVTTEGYLFKMNSDDELTISGELIDSQTPINLATGYQMISYLPWQALNALDVCENILENLDFVRNTVGLMLRKIGPVWVNSIGNMNPGEGYLVK